jgi:allophanate hydrolase subunit 2
LQKGDVVSIGPPSGGGLEWTGKSAGLAEGVRKRKLSARALQGLEARKVLRVTPGPQSDWFPEAAQRVFYESRYRVAEESNRMGIRLEGAAIPEVSGGKMISEGVSLGAVQVPDGGQPIILFVEQQTTGGYPKIANVISADLHSVGQLRPRDEIRFERVDWETARSLLREQEELLASEELIIE